VKGNGHIQRGKRKILKFNANISETTNLLSHDMGRMGTR